MLLAMDIEVQCSSEYGRWCWLGVRGSKPWGMLVGTVGSTTELRLQHSTPNTIQEVPMFHVLNTTGTHGRQLDGGLQEMGITTMHRLTSNVHERMNA